MALTKTFDSFLAHSENNAGVPDPLSEHLLRVAELAEKFASAFDAGLEAKVAGLLHDLGKYGELFQRRLKGLEQGIDHWSLGAWHALMEYKINGLASALAIQGHHIGLAQGGKGDLARLNPERLKSSHPLGLRLSSNSLENLLERMQAEGLNLPREIGQSLFPGPGKLQVAGMIDVRMLFSALVDADFLDTEAHFQGDPLQGLRRYRPTGPELEPEILFKGLMDHLGTLLKKKKASGKVMEIRSRVLEDCLAAAMSEPGIFTLTAPTGSGKTLSLLAFALKHALTLLMHDVRSALESVGLDPAVGFLHRDRPGRPGLALDMMEEFRPFLADRLALSLINLCQVNAKGFIRSDTGAVTMTDGTRKQVLVSYQKRKQDEITHPFLGEKVAIGILPHIQALLLARFLRGDLDGYPPFIWR